MGFVPAYLKIFLAIANFILEASSENPLINHTSTRSLATIDREPAV